MTGCFGGKDMENEIGKTRINVYLKCVQLWPALANSFNQFPTSFKKKARAFHHEKLNELDIFRNFMT